MNEANSSGKRLGWILVPLGLALVMVSVLADAVGIGSGDYVFGWEQKAGVFLGMGLVTYSFMRARAMRRTSPARLPTTRPVPVTVRSSASASI